MAVVNKGVDERMVVRMEVSGNAGGRALITDSALIARAGAGDTDAFADLLAPRLDRLWRNRPGDPRQRG